MKKFLFQGIVLLFLVMNSFSQTGSPDPAFGSAGKVHTNILNVNAQPDGVRTMALQADGKILIVGNHGDMGFLIRYNTDGTPDNSFDGDGMVLCFRMMPNAVAIQSDGKMVVAGYSYTGSNTDFALARYNTDGSPDNSFDGDGKLTTAIGSSDEQVNSIIIQSDGKIVAAGFSLVTSNYDFALVRYNTDGSLDNSFDGDGKLTTAIGTSNELAFSVKIQSDGKIVAAGTSFNGSNNDFALVRYNSNGSLDNSFDSDGKLTTAIGSLDDVVSSMAIQSDGKIVVAGNSHNGTNNDFALVRYNSTGGPDNSFDGDGKLVTNINSSDDYGKSIAIQTDGKIVVAGTADIAGNYDFVLARYNTNGSPDNSFDGDGKLTTAIGTANDQALSMAIQSDGKIIAAGFSYTAASADFALARYNTNGSLDIGFDGDGKITAYIPSSSDEAAAMAVQSDGKIIVAGYGNSGSDVDFALVRYNADGSPDNIFDGDGKLTSDMGSVVDRIAAIAIQTDGRIVVAGYTFNGSNYDFALARYNSNGSLDNSFDGDGKLTTAIGTANDQATAVAIQSDGKIVVAGYCANAGGYDFVLARYNTNGSPDNNFDGDGKLTTAIGAADDYATSIAIQNDGKIIVAGYSYNGSNYDFALARYNTNGSLDEGFDGDGKLITAIGSANEQAASVAIQSDGKVVVAGYSYNGSSNDFALARYNTNGSLDNNFDGDGKLTTAISAGDDRATSLAIQSDGKIVVGGYGYNANNPDFALTRYNTNGSLDNGFDGDGKAIFDLGLGSSEFGRAMKLHANRILLAGSILIANNNDFALIAVVNDASPLPLQLLDLSGKLTNANAVLTWKTESEVNTSAFVVERSTDGASYQAMGTIAAANSAGTHHYSFTDPNITSLNAPVIYYRLQQKDIDGRFTYSRMVALSVDQNKSIVLFYPNPVISEANLTVTISKPESVQAQIIDQAGRIVKQWQWNLQAGSTSLPVDLGRLAPGMYYLDVKGTNLHAVKQFVKQ